MKSKKIFVLLAALALSLAACGPKPGSSQQGGESQPGGESSEVQPSSQGGGEAGSSEQGGGQSSQSGEVAVTSVTLDQTTLALEVGKSANLKATVLPANASNTKVTWEIDNATVASVSSLGKVTALKVGNAKITAKSQSNPDVKAECQLTVSEEGGKYGSASKPKTVAQILAIAAEECKNANDKTSDVVYVKGIVSKAPNNKGTFSQNIYLKDALTDEKDLLVYSANHDALKEPYQNDEVVLHGYLMNYNGTIEISNVTIDGNKVYPEVDSVTRGTSTISYEISHGSINAEAPTSAKNLSEFTFTVTPDANYKVDLVTINGADVAAETDGSYKGLVKGNMAVKVTISEVGVENLRAVMKYTAPEGATTSTNMTGGNDAALVNLDASLFTVISGNETGIYAGLNVANNIRLYNNRNSETDKTNGTHITVSSVKATIKSIEITLASTSVADAILQVKAGDDVVEGNNLEYTINAGSFTLKNVTDGPDSKQIHITQVAITYTMNQEVHATGISVAPATLALEAGQTGQLTATVAPSNSTDVVTWSSNAVAVATVDSTGRVTAVAAGSAVITAQVSETIKATATVTVTAAAAINYGTAEHPLTIAEAKAVLDKTGSNQSAEPLYVKGIVSTNKAFNTTYHNGEIWLQSDDGSVAKAFELYSCEIDSSIANASSYETADALKGCEVVATGYGKIYGTTYELTNITLDGNRVNPRIVSLVPPQATDPTAIALDKTTAQLEAGETLQLTASLEPAGATGTVVWSSNAEAVATVNQSGLVTAVGAGSAIITATVGELSATCTVTVTAVDPDIVKATLKYNGTENKTCADFTGDALTQILNLDKDIFTVTYDKNGASNDMALRTDGMRMYATKSSANGNKITVVAAAGYEIKTIKVFFDDGYSATAKVYSGTTLVEGASGVYTIDGSAFTIFNDNTSVSSNTQVRFQKVEISYKASATPIEPTVLPLPIIAKGNQDTKVEGAGAWIYLNTTGLELNAEMAAAMAAAADIDLTVAMTDETPESAVSAAQNYVTGQAAAPVIISEQVRFDDFGTNTVRLYIGMDKGLDNSWKMKHSFEISIPLDAETVFEGSVVFVGGELREINGEAYVAPVVIEQPIGTFFASAEITDAGKTALSTTNSIVPVFITLGTGTASVSVNGVSAGTCTLKQFDQSNGWLVITTASFGDISMQYNPENGRLEKLSVLANTGILKYDGGQSLRGNDELHYWNCDGTDSELQADFNRRSGNSSWSLDSETDRIVKNTEHAISGSAMQVNKKSDNKERIALSLKDFAQPFNARNISFWVYNDGESSVNLQSFYYKQVNYGGYQQIFSGKAVAAGQWTYVSVGFTAADVYAFQIVIPQGTASTLIFDDICLF